MNGRRLTAMTTLLVLALIVTVAALAPIFGTDSRNLAGRGNRGNHPTSVDAWWDLQRYLPR
jgi:hypothetical protein